PPRDRRAVPHGDHWLRDRRHDAGRAGPVEAWAAASAAVAVLRALALVAAAGEGAIARAREHRDADVGVVPGGAEGGDELVDRLGAERVQHLRTVDGDPRDAVTRLVEDVLVARRRSGHRPAFPPRGPLLSSWVRRGTVRAR